MKRAAIIGMGDIYPIHLAAISANENIQLAAVCDIDPQAKERAPEGVPFYTDWKQMVEEVYPDCVHICLPHYLHVPISREAVAMGLNVFCEKPIGLNTTQAKELVESEQSHPGQHVGICLQNRRNETVEMLKQIIDSKEYGELKGIRGLVCWNRPKSYYDVKPWRGKKEFAGGGCMINQSVHTLDLMYYLAGPVSSLSAVSSQILDYGIEVEDTVTAQLRFENGAYGLFFATNANSRNESVVIHVDLEKAEFEIDRSVLYRIDEAGNRIRLEEDAKMPGSKFYYGASHSKIIGEFYRALEQGSQEYLHAQDALMSIELIDAIQKSSQTGKPVFLQEIEG